jgi:hypothetical protein
MPSIPGLEEWVQRFPDLVRHSRQYRRSEAYANQTVLLIGASVGHPPEPSLSPADKRSRSVGLRFLETLILRLERSINLSG